MQVLASCNIDMYVVVFFSEHKLYKLRKNELIIIFY